MKAFSFFSTMALALTLSVASVHAATDVYGVTGVQSGEFLNMRSDAGVSNAITGRIPFNGQGIVTTGEEKKVSGTLWAKVYWNGVGGWVSKRYLLAEGQTATTPTKPVTTRPLTVPPPKVVVPPAKPSANKLVCSGTEPFWSVEISDTNLIVNMMDGPRYSVPVTFRQTSANNTTIAVIGGASGTNNTQAFMQKVNSCSDGMSDMSYPYSVTAVLNNSKVVSGCCKVQ
ncbi:MAG: hypothetical protein RL122_1035 [Pseudomonadota bacterium]|jgi:uncharacterized membrane protein|uniref:SH3b domain-containing protein n=1 Tax=Thiothrix fructosivorans TaxID=111770 RepID=A0A8B0SIW1_9GAMM|nr:SH3 domain-containing protein [Thiothrix fructosivorans]MBO0614020.1 hypothetical protein [Thiothrix fructosivorans]QTX10380.1 hypothetical protein J1836_017635 [Thiothrix fructosivorans]